MPKDSEPKKLRHMANGAMTRGILSADNPRGQKSEFLPQYMVVAKDVIKMIYDGEFRPGAKLPSMRVLAKKYGVSVQVILSAFQWLSALHYIETRPKSGVFVSADVKPSRFYRIGVFVMNQNPFAYGGLLYDLNNELTAAGYTVIIGTNYDSGWRLKLWAAHKRNLDGCIIVGMPFSHELEQFKRITVPYMLLAANPDPRVGQYTPDSMRLFVKWFVDDVTTRPMEERPLFLYNPALDPALESEKPWEEYQAVSRYGFQKTGDKLEIIRK